MIIRKLSQTLKHVFATNRLFSSQKFVKDYYNILGVEKNASLAQIKLAFADLAKKLHPDYNKSILDKEKFLEVREAYIILSNEQKRKEYDDIMNIRSSFYGNYAFETEENPFSFFIKYKNKPISEFYFKETPLHIKFKHALHGTIKQIPIKLTVRCPCCKGFISGGPKTIKCPDCQGSGIKHDSEKASCSKEPCKTCQGKEFISNTYCPSCQGIGILHQTTMVEITIPPGIQEGQIINKSISGKEYLFKIYIGKNKYFSRQGADVHSYETISIMQAMLGCTIKAKGLYGKFDVEVPKGSNSTTCIRIAGKGFPLLSGSGFGDHYVHLAVNNADEDQRRKTLNVHASRNN